MNKYQSLSWICAIAEKDPHPVDTSDLQLIDQAVVPSSTRVAIDSAVND